MYRDLVEQATTTTGTGAYTVAGAVTGRRSFADAFADGDSGIPYVVSDEAGGFEVGLGTWDEDTLALARTVVLASSNAGAAVNWAAGSKRIYVSPHSGVMGLAAQKHNLAAAVAPTINDDANDGYGVGSLWYTAAAAAAADKLIYFCADPTVGAARWMQLVGSGPDHIPPTAFTPRVLRGRNTNAAMGSTGYTWYNGSNTAVGYALGDGAVTGLFARTTNATPTRMALDGDHASNLGIYIEGRGCTTIMGTVSAVDTASGDVKAWEVKAVLQVDDTGAITFQLGAAPAELYESAGATAWSIALVTPDTYDMTIEVTGEAATTIVWSAALLVNTAAHF